MNEQDYRRRKADAVARLQDGCLRVALVAGGVGAGVRNLIPALASRAAVTLITASRTDTFPGVKTVSVDGEQLDYMSLSRRLCAKAQELVDKRSIDLVHGHSSREYLVAGVPKVAQPHGCFKANEAQELESRLPWVRWLYRLTGGRGLARVEGASLRTAVRIVAVSKANAEEVQRFWRLPTDKFRVVYNALPEDWLKVDWAEMGKEEAGRRAPAAYFAGRFCREKPIVDVVRAWVQSELKTRLTLLGPTRADVESLVPEAAVDSRIECRGWITRAEMARTLSSLDILVHPSLREGFSMTILEAMCMGKCVVAYDIPPVREAVGDAGFLLPPGSVGSIIQAIRDLERQPAAIRDAGDRYYRKRLGFTPSASVNTLLGVYGEALTAT